MRQQLRMSAAILIAPALMASVLAAPALAARQRGAGATTARWHFAYQTPLRVSNDLLSVTATGPRHAWAVGDTLHGTNDPVRGFALDWNGRRWAMMKALPAGFWPESVEASAPDNVWVFGSPKGVGDAALRWNGSSWQQVAIPGAYGYGSAAVVSPSDVWFGIGRTLYHWTGTGTWQRVTMPLSAYQFDQLAAAPGGQAWFAGKTRSGRLAAERWTGRTWQPVRMPHPRITFTPMVSVGSTGDVWFSFSRKGIKHLVLLHWNGRRWRTLSIHRFVYGAMAPAGRGRLWIGGQALWNGRRWLEGVPVADMGAITTGIPGTDSAWGVLTWSKSNSSRQHSGIVRNGLVP